MSDVLARLRDVRPMATADLDAAGTANLQLRRGLGSAEILAPADIKTVAYRALTFAFTNANLPDHHPCVAGTSHWRITHDGARSATGRALLMVAFVALEAGET